MYCMVNVGVCLSVGVCRVCMFAFVCVVSSLSFKRLRFIFAYRGSPILIKPGPIRASERGSWPKASQSVTLPFTLRPGDAAGWVNVQIQMVKSC